MQTLLKVIVFLSISAQVFAQDFYVSPTGSDQANGLSRQAAANNNGPFQTLLRAQLAVRELKVNGQFKQPVTIHIAAGFYRLEQPLTFDIRDTGFAGREISWQADNGPVILSGGLPLSNCEKSKQLWTCPLPDISRIKFAAQSRKKAYFTLFNLYVNEHRFHLARWPDSGWAHIRLPLDANTKFSSMEALPDMADAGQAQVHIFAGNDWHDEYIPLAAIDRIHNEITLAAAPAYAFVSGRRYYLQNLLSELNAADEWYYDKANAKVLFMAAAGVEPDNVIISASTSLLSIERANYLSFHNLTLRHTLSAAVSINNAANITLDGLEINNVDAGAIDAINSRAVSIVNNNIHDTGEGGVYITGGDRTTLQAANNVVHNNHIHHFANTILAFCPAVETQGVGSRISHNLIEYGASAGVVIGGNEHILEKNEISHVCDQTADCGAIYDGRNWTDRGNVIRYNNLHDIYGYGLLQANAAENTVSYAQAGAVGVYLDDGMSGFNIYGNIFNNAGTMAIQLGGGRDNFIQNNVFFSKACAICVDARWPAYDWSPNRSTLQSMPIAGAAWRSKYPTLAAPMSHDTWPEGNSIINNIIISSHDDDGAVLQYTLPAQTNRIASNLLWAAQGQFKVSYNILDMPNRAGTVLGDDWLKQGLEAKSLQADPCVSFSANQVSFCATAPLRDIGFQALPNDIGLLGASHDR